MFERHKYLKHKTQIIHISLHKFSRFLTNRLEIEIKNNLLAIYKYKYMIINIIQIMKNQ